MIRRRKTVLFLAAGIFLVLLVSWLYRQPAGGVNDAKPEKAAGVPDRALSPSAVLSISASRASPPISVMRQPAQTLVQEFDRSARLRPLYDRLNQGAAATADGKLALYLVLRECAKGGGEDRRAYPDVNALAKSIPDEDVNKQMRLRIAGELRARCEALEAISTSPEELQRLLKESAALGNHTARVRLISRELQESAQAGMPPSLSDAQLETLRAAVRSGDPDAISSAGILLSNTFADLVVESAATHASLQPEAAFNAWRLLACEYGDDCSSSNLWLRSECALNGECAATTLEDAVFFYHLPPYQAQVLDQYRTLFRNAANGDWSGLTFARRPGGLGGRYYYSIP
jgi:hypothetical protein